MANSFLLFELSKYNGYPTFLTTKFRFTPNKGAISQNNILGALNFGKG